MAYYNIDTQIIKFNQNDLSTNLQGSIHAFVMCGGIQMIDVHRNMFSFLSFAKKEMTQILSDSEFLIAIGTSVFNSYAYEIYYLEI